MARRVYMYLKRCKANRSLAICLQIQQTETTKSRKKPNFRKAIHSIKTSWSLDSIEDEFYEDDDEILTISTMEINRNNSLDKAISQPENKRKINIQCLQGLQGLQGGHTRAEQLALSVQGSLTAMITLEKEEALSISWWLYNLAAWHYKYTLPIQKQLD